MGEKYLISTFIFNYVELQDSVDGNGLEDSSVRAVPQLSCPWEVHLAIFPVGPDTVGETLNSKELLIEIDICKIVLRPSLL